MKNVLEENHRIIVQQYQETMSNQFNKLKTRLEEAQDKNVDLEENLFSLTQKIEEVIKEKVLEIFLKKCKKNVHYLSLLIVYNF